METKAAAVTVSDVDPLTAPELAPIVLVPTLLAEASPPLEIVATAGDEEVQVIVLVRFCVLPSV